MRGPVKERLGAQVHETEGNGEVISVVNCTRGDLLRCGGANH